MEFFAFAFCALTTWAFISILEKIVIGTKGMNPFSYLIATYCFGVLLLPMPFLTPLKFPALSQSIFLIAAGAFLFLGFIGYFWALRIEEVSRVVPLWNLIPVFVVIFSHLILGEFLSFRKWIAFVFLVGGGFFISLEKAGGILKLRRAFFLMLLPTLFIAIHDVYIKYLSMGRTGLETMDIFYLVRLGSTGMALLFFLMPKFRTMVLKDCNRMGSSWLAIIILGVLINMAAWFSFYKALQLGQISILSSLAGFLSLFVLLLSILVTRLFPSLLQEEVSPKVLAEKALAILLIFTGLVILFKPFF